MVLVDPPLIIKVGSNKSCSCCLEFLTLSKLEKVSSWITYDFCDFQLYYDISIFGLKMSATYFVDSDFTYFKIGCTTWGCKPSTKPMIFVTFNL